MGLLLQFIITITVLLILSYLQLTQSYINIYERLLQEASEIIKAVIIKFVIKLESCDIRLFYDVWVQHDIMDTNA